MPAVKTGMTPPPMPGMPAPMQPMGGMPPAPGMPAPPSNPFAPMPPMPLAGGPPPQMPPMPQVQGQQMQGATAGRRRRFGDALEGMLGRNQGLGAAMPQPQRAMPPQMMQQQRMVAPGTPMMRTPPMQSMMPRPMEMGGEVDIFGYADGGPVVQYYEDAGEVEPFLNEFDTDSGTYSYGNKTGLNVDEYKALNAETQAFLPSNSGSGFSPATDQYFFQGSPMSASEYSAAVKAYRGENPELAALVDSVNRFNPETKTYTVASGGDPDTAVQYSYGTTYDDPTTETVEELPADVAYSKRVQENRAAMGLPANTTSAWELYQRGEHYSQGRPVVEDVVNNFVDLIANDNVDLGGGDDLGGDNVVVSQPVSTITGAESGAGGNFGTGSYTAAPVDSSEINPIDYSQFTGDVGSTTGGYDTVDPETGVVTSGTREQAALFGPKINIPQSVSQYYTDPVTGGLTTSYGPEMVATSPIGAIKLPARPVEIDIFDFLSTPTYGTMYSGIDAGDVDLYEYGGVNNMRMGGEVSGPFGGSSVPRSAMIADQPHMLAYINQDEEALLRSFGGSGIAGPGGIPSYPPGTTGYGSGEGTGYGSYSDTQSRESATDNRVSDDDDDDYTPTSAELAAQLEAQGLTNITPGPLSVEDQVAQYKLFGDDNFVEIPVLPSGISYEDFKSGNYEGSIDQFNPARGEDIPDISAANADLDADQAAAEVMKSAINLGVLDDTILGPGEGGLSAPLTVGDPLTPELALELGLSDIYQEGDTILLQDLVALNDLGFDVDQGAVSGANLATVELPEDFAEFVGAMGAGDMDTNEAFATTNLLGGYDLTDADVDALNTAVENTGLSVQQIASGLGYDTVAGFLEELSLRIEGTAKMAEDVIGDMGVYDLAGQQFEMQGGDFAPGSESNLYAAIQSAVAQEELNKDVKDVGDSDFVQGLITTLNNADEDNPGLAQDLLEKRDPEYVAKVALQMPNPDNEGFNMAGEPITPGLWMASVAAQELLGLGLDVATIAALGPVAGGAVAFQQGTAEAGAASANEVVSEFEELKASGALDHLSEEEYDTVLDTAETQAFYTSGLAGGAVDTLVALTAGGFAPLSKALPTAINSALTGLGVLTAEGGSGALEQVGVNAAVIQALEDQGINPADYDKEYLDQVITAAIYETVGGTGASAASTVGSAVQNLSAKPGDTTSQTGTQDKFYDAFGNEFSTAAEASASDDANLTASEILQSGENVTVSTDNAGNLVLTDNDTNESVTVGGSFSTGDTLTGGETKVSDLQGTEDAVIGGTDQNVVVSNVGGNLTLTNEDTGFTAVVGAGTNANLINATNAVQNSDADAAVAAGATVGGTDVTASETLLGTDTNVDLGFEGLSDADTTDANTTITANNDATVTTSSDGNVTITTATDSQGNAVVTTKNNVTGETTTDNVAVNNAATVTNGGVTVDVNAATDGTTTTTTETTQTGVSSEVEGVVDVGTTADAITQAATTTTVEQPQTLVDQPQTLVAQPQPAVVQPQPAVVQPQKKKKKKSSATGPVGETQPGYTSGIADLGAGGRMRPVVAPYYQPQQTGLYSFYRPQPGVDQTPAAPVFNEPTSYLSPTGGLRYGNPYIGTNLSLAQLRELAELQGTGAALLPSEDLMNGS